MPASARSNAQPQPQGDAGTPLAQATSSLGSGPPPKKEQAYAGIRERTRVDPKSRKRCTGAVLLETAQRIESWSVLLGLTNGEVIDQAIMAWNPKKPIAPDRVVALLEADLRALVKSAIEAHVGRGEPPQRTTQAYAKGKVLPGGLIECAKCHQAFVDPRKVAPKRGGTPGRVGRPPAHCQTCRGTQHA